MTATAHAEEWKQQFQKASDEYFDQLYFPAAPTTATLTGYHQYDDRLEDYSRAGIDRQIAQLQAFQHRFERILGEQQKQSHRIPAGEAGSRGARFEAVVAKDGKIEGLRLVQKDPALTDEQVRQLEKKIFAFPYRPYAQDGAPTATKTEISVYQTEWSYDPVFADLEIVQANIRSQLLTLETIRPWEKNPDAYPSLCANAAFSLMERNFASPAERLRSLTAREKQMPALLEAARANLKNPPRIYTEIAIEQLPGTIGFFERDVPQAFSAVKEEALQKEFAQTNAATLEALRSYLAWLKSDLLPRSQGDYRIGAETFAKKLAYDEMVTTPLPKLLEIAYADLHRNQAHFQQIAKELDPGKDTAAVLDELGRQHPAPDQLLNAFGATFDGLIAFLRERRIVTLPTDVKPILEETPPFMRATTFASMDTPGPYEQRATEAYFNVTLPDAKMRPDEVEGYMHAFNIGTILSTSVHEAYPGHYVQLMWLSKAPSRVRKVLGALTYIEGWAHYTEQMMLDVGYGQPGYGAKDAREARLLRLGQLQDALLRNARFVAGIEMHTGKMSFDDVVRFFEKEGYQSHETALVEAKRGTSDPTYLYYTLGKLEILKLREDVQRKQGEAFSLQKFHDDFLREGFPPIRIVRQAMLGDNSPAL